MKTVLGSLSVLIMLTLVVSSCGERQDSPVGIGSPDSPLALAGKGQGKGGSDSNSVVQFSLSGGYETDPVFQSAVTVNDNKKRMQIEGGGLDGVEGLFGAKYIAMTFADKVEACAPDQNEVDDATLAELMAQLNDPLQNRTFYALIEKSGASVSEVKSVYHESGSVGSQKYRTELRGGSATEGPTDTFTLTGGSVWILKDGFGQSILCPFTGTLVLTVDRG